MVFPVIVAPAVIAVTVSYPLGTTSSAATPVASFAPLFTTVNVKVTVSPTLGIVVLTALEILRSENTIGVSAVSVSAVGISSVVTEAVFTNVTPAWKSANVVV